MHSRSCGETGTVSQLSRGYRRRKNLRAVQLLLGHTEIESAVRYFGIEVDALEKAEQAKSHDITAGKHECLRTSFSTVTVVLC